MQCVTTYLSLFYIIGHINLGQGLTTGSPGRTTVRNASIQKRMPGPRFMLTSRDSRTRKSPVESPSVLSSMKGAMKLYPSDDSEPHDLRNVEKNEHHDVRRKAIRSTLTSAIACRQFRLATGLILNTYPDSGRLGYKVLAILSVTFFIIAFTLTASLDAVVAAPALPLESGYSFIKVIASGMLVVSAVASAFFGILWSIIADGEDSVAWDIQADDKSNRLLTNRRDWKPTTTLFGWKLPPNWVKVPLELKRAESFLEQLIEDEYLALTDTNFPSPVVGKATYYQYLVLGPLLLDAYVRYSDPVLHNLDRSAPRDDPETQVVKIFDFGLALSVIQNLWYLPVLSILSGISPAIRIVAETHISRLPDTPIAHDMDTLLLWPAIGNSWDRGLPSTVFQTPAAAITDVSQYNVDWNAVTNVFFSTVLTSMGYSSLLAVCFYFYLFFGQNRMENPSFPPIEKDEHCPKIK